MTSTVLLPERKKNAVAFLDRVKSDGGLQRQIRSRTTGGASAVAEIINVAAEEGFDFGEPEYLAAVADSIDSEHAAAPNMMATCCCVHTSNTSSSKPRSLKPKL